MRRHGQSEPQAGAGAHSRSLRTASAGQGSPTLPEKLSCGVWGSVTSSSKTKERTGSGRLNIAGLRFAQICALRWAESKDEAAPCASTRINRLGQLPQPPHCRAPARSLALSAGRPSPETQAAFKTAENRFRLYQRFIHYTV